jgi:hypothetical protein
MTAAAIAGFTAIAPLIIEGGAHWRPKRLAEREEGKYTP